VSSAAYRLTLNYSDKNTFLSDIPWTVSFIGATNSDNLLDDDEKAEITGWILDRNTQTAGDGGGAGGMTSSDTVLTTGDRFTVEIIAEGGAVIAIERNLPDAFKNVMDLR